MTFLFVTLTVISAPFFFVLGYVWGINEPCMFCTPRDESENQVGSGEGE